MEFKDIIKTQRSKLKLTLDDVARYVGVSGATVSRWENGDIENMRRDKIAKLADILQVTPSYLMGWEGDQQLSANTTESLGDRIRSKRQERDLTQMELAAKCGMADSAIRKYELGRVIPKIETVQRIADALDANLLDFIDILPDGHSSDKVNVIQSFIASIEGELEKGKRLAWRNNSLCLEYPSESSRIEPAPPHLSDAAMQIARDYDGLDGHGRRVVRLVADEEKARCSERARSELPDESPDIIYFNLPKYHQRMSAGTGQPAGDEWGENLLLTKQPPRGASYVATISGQSMEPTYHDGDQLFIQATVDIQVGQVGVFLMEGQQWVKELGDGVLLSHNPAYPPRPLTEDVRCQGVVLGVCDESYFA